MLGFVGGFVCMRMMGIGMLGKRWFDVEHMFVTCICTSLNIYCFCSEFDRSIILAQQPPSSLLLCQTSMMLTYYIVFGAFEIVSDRSNNLMVVHHVLAASIILYAHATNVHQCTCAFLMLFTISNPPLAIAKVYHRDGDGAGSARIARIAFGIFAVTYFVSRICLVPCLIWVMMTDGWTIAVLTGQYTAYWCMNTMLVGLYVMQLAWFPSIVKICMRKVLRD